jgi:hypothetical protein
VLACYTLQFVFIGPVTSLTAYPLTRWTKLHIVCSQSRGARQTKAQQESTGHDTNYFWN